MKKIVSVVILTTILALPALAGDGVMGMTRTCPNGQTTCLLETETTVKISTETVKSENQTNTDSKSLWELFIDFFGIVS